MHWVNVRVQGFNKNYPNVCVAHYRDVIMGAIASQIISLTIVYSTVYSDADQRKHQSSGEFPAQMASNAENVSIWSSWVYCTIYIESTVLVIAWKRVTYSYLLCFNLYMCKWWCAMIIDTHLQHASKALYETCSYPDVSLRCQWHTLGRQKSCWLLAPMLSMKCATLNYYLGQR